MIKMNLELNLEVEIEVQYFDIDCQEDTEFKAYLKCGENRIEFSSELYALCWEEIYNKIYEDQVSRMAQARVENYLDSLENHWR